MKSNFESFTDHCWGGKLSWMVRKRLDCEWSVPYISKTEGLTMVALNATPTPVLKLAFAPLFCHEAQTDVCGVCVYVQDACAEKSLIIRHGLVYRVKRREHERDRRSASLHAPEA